MGTELGTKLMIVTPSPSHKQCTALFTSHNMGTETSVSTRSLSCCILYGDKKIIPNMGTELGTKLMIVTPNPMRKQCTALFTSHNTGTETSVEFNKSKINDFASDRKIIPDMGTET